MIRVKDLLSLYEGDITVVLGPDIDAVDGPELFCGWNDDAIDSEFANLPVVRFSIQNGRNLVTELYIEISDDDLTDEQYSYLYS